MAPSSTSAAFTQEATHALLRDACGEVGLDPTGAELVRLGENAIYVLASSPTVVRIARASDHWEDAAKEIAVARWLNEHAIRSARATGPDRPIEISGHPVTFWQYIDGRGGQPRDVEGLGALLRRIHQLPRPVEFQLPDLDPLGRVQKRLDYAQVPGQDHQLLTDRLTMLARELPKLAYPLPPSFVHGDAHVENLMVDSDGPILIDFERAAWGHPEWDLSVTATEFLSAGFWTAEQYAAFVETYGYDVTEWSGFRLLRQTNELKMTSWLMQNVNESDAIRHEYEVRMETIRSGEPGTSHWTPF